MLLRLAFQLALRAEHDPKTRAVVNAGINGVIRLLAAEKRAGGSRLMNLARREASAFGRYRADRLKERLGLDTSHMGDMGRLQDWEDRGFGVTGSWTERGRSRAVKCETECPFSDAAKAVPEFCSDVVHAFETSTYRELNPTYRLVPVTRLLSLGDTLCEFVHEID